MSQLTIQSIQGKILSLPNRPPFMLTRDLAEIYETDPRQINQAVRRNPERFPEDFCFDLSADEIGRLQNEAIISNQHVNGRQRAFTRMGANQLSTVLKSKVAAQRSVQIMRAFSAMEESAQRPVPDMDAMLSQLFGHADSQHVLLTKDRYIQLLEGALESQNLKIKALENPAPHPEFGKRRRWTKEEEQTVRRLRTENQGFTRIGIQLVRTRASVESHWRRLQARTAGGAA